MCGLDSSTLIPVCAFTGPTLWSQVVQLSTVTSLSHIPSSGLLPMPFPLLEGRFMKAFYQFPVSKSISPSRPSSNIISLDKSQNSFYRNISFFPSLTSIEFFLSFPEICL